ncbi:probable 2-oxoglutarate dehydrogenase E1 component DHKTD1 homolog, mitochondrial isoform X2 [Episyrphus balteatus]|uniref:probable 2-oxoglutarate dehydrogenase E1 component DHKTD1 homolog, mitochondrial isoform X2 n=1 Tax=Episyrphus balteatus TaxID=286459 RepID=UPI002485966E|nr:probable 2-oxoglutarate dehydrogenase E1 component DHKTD1 homolog, mitochondrial isoform X2 [Episyrphus balteatus]
MRAKVVINEHQYHLKGFEKGYVSEDILQSRNSQPNVFRWVEAYRKHGHKLASINPVAFKPNSSSFDELTPEYYGLRSDDRITPRGILNVSDIESTTTVGEIQKILNDIYCNAGASVEFAYIENQEEREWLAENFEKLRKQNVSTDGRRKIAELLIKSQAWDNFLAAKFPTVKRYGGEGAESLLAFFWQLFASGVEEKLQHIVVGMPHRGRGNLLTTMLNLRPAKVFRKFKGESEFADGVNAMSDVVSHFHAAEELDIDGKKIRVSILRNPSHLEAANPVSMGKTRSKQQTASDGAFSEDPEKPFSTSVLNVILHGDAALPGQGVNQECLNMAYVPHFEVGGTIHMVVNNQVGFTTPAETARSTDYATDLAKTIQAPVFHVNGDNPEQVAIVTQLAFAYQRKFRKDVFIDMNCFRRWGHNELDDPTFTNPALYSVIENRKSVPDTYAEHLASAEILSSNEANQVRTSFMNYLTDELANVNSYQPEPTYFQRQWSELQSAPNAITYWDTGLDYSLLHYIGTRSVQYPGGFNIHPHLLKTHVEGRLRKLNSGQKIDWATAEALAIGSLLYQGRNVRLSGEDVGRGTFSHRHVMLVDQKTNEMFIPLNSMEQVHCGKLEVAHSILSEEAVLGFEYGMAIDNPNNLIIWEAQFGDFANGAQIIFDNFIFTGETKWMDSNGLVILLPHGYDGAASEHSSCRIERFLQLTDSKETSPDGDDVNVHIVNPTTPAQYYHLLRRQIVRNFRKPLIVVAPKTLLRLSAATSVHTDFQPGTFFRNVIGDCDVLEPGKVDKVILCSGRHYYTLNDERVAKKIGNCAIVRVESLCPFPVHEIQEELAKYKNVKSIIWSQEESRNAGAWSFIRPRFEHMIGKQLKYCGRAEAATTATGIGKIHKKELEDIVLNPFRA